MNSKPTFKITTQEKALLDQIDFELEGDVIASLRASGALMPLLLKRKAIPDIRLRYFSDPELNIGRGSRKEVFEGNGTRGAAIFEHGNFIKYLHYFIYGPDLPADVLTPFQERVREACGFVSSSDWPELEAICKQGIRRHRLDPKEFSEEVHKLALECDIDPFTARHLRAIVRRMK